MDLLRPSWWVEHYNLSVGRAIDLRVSELQLDGTAIVTSLAACCPVADGSGSVVTGRFVTREVSNLVEIVLENGTTLTGTSTHPVWTVNHHDWTPLAELVPGDLVDTDTGPQPIASIRTLNHVSDVFNIEVHGHHVYRVTKDAILVHNACPDVPDAPKGERVYQHLDDAGRENYIGISENLRRRSGQHRLDPEKTGQTMRPLTDALTHDQVRTIEAMRIRQRLDEARLNGLIDGTEPIAEQLQKAGLLNKNRGRDPSRWVDIDPDDFIKDFDDVFDIRTPDGN